MKQNLMNCPFKAGLLYVSEAATQLIIQCHNGLISLSSDLEKKKQ